MLTYTIILFDSIITHSMYNSIVLGYLILCIFCINFAYIDGTCAYVTKIKNKELSINMTIIIFIVCTNFKCKLMYRPVHRTMHDINPLDVTVAKGSKIINMCLGYLWVLRVMSKKVHYFRVIDQDI